jgi:pimeloyl-ACP methyl ester carboxylesterase
MSAAAATPRRLYASTPGGQIHGRMLGHGAPLLMLHPSPLSSAFLAEQQQALSRQWRTIALDTPGYGMSDPLPQPAQSLHEYATALLAAADNLGVERFALYGNATGAQLALVIARTAPERVTRLVLENCGLFTDADVAAWEAHYFPDLSPQPDGSHLRHTWEVSRRQFVAFPWFSEASGHQLQRPAPPPETVQAMALHYQLAGPDYHQAYRLAFRSERRESFDGLRVPCVLIDWHGSIVRPQVQALIAAGLPGCVEVLEAGASQQARLAAVVQAFGT